MRRRQIRTLIVNGIPEQENAENGGKDWCARGVLRVEVSGFDTRRSGGNSGTLWQLRVEVYDSRHTRARSTGLCEMNYEKCRRTREELSG